jgi:prepilin-type N-terminal cleavage/methylation domain-containing protein
MKVHGFRKAGRSGGGITRRRGFSLLELLAVMSIVALLSTLAVTSYFSAIRGMAGRAVRRNLTNALTAARQRACIEGCRVSLVAYNEAAALNAAGTEVKDRAAAYVVCRELGRVSFVRSGQLFDEFGDLDRLFGTGSGTSSSDVGAMKLYNLRSGGWVYVRRYVKEDAIGSQDHLVYENLNYTFKGYAFELLTGSGASGGSSPAWQVGDAYGVEVMPAQALPKGYRFRELTTSDSLVSALTDVKAVTFKPDGTAENGQTFTVVPPERDASAKGVDFNVTQQGVITVSELK